MVLEVRAGDLGWAGATVAGAATRVVVTPAPGHPLGGYADRQGPAHGTLDDLEVQVGRLTDARGRSAVWVVLDVLAITDVLRARIATAVAATMGVDPDVVVVVATHTHAAPSGWTGTIHPVLPARRDDALITALVDAVVAACRDMSPRPVTLRRTVVEVVGGGANRHRPDGPHDRSAGVVTWCDADTDRPMAVQFDFACHPTVLGPDNDRYSADWVGAARRTVRMSAGAADLPVLFLQGAAGDISPRFVRRGRDAAEVDRLGAIIGRAVAEGLGGPVESAPDVHVTRTSITVPTRSPADVHPASGTERDTADSADRDAAARIEGDLARRAIQAAGIPAALVLPLTVVQVGALSWLHLPGELVASYGLGLRRHAAPSILRVVGYSDGYAGYFADPPAHAAGHYEALSSYLDVCGTETLVRACRDLVDSTVRSGRRAAE